MSASVSWVPAIDPPPRTGARSARLLGGLVGAGVAVASLLVSAIASATLGDIARWPDTLGGWLSAVGPTLGAGTLGGFLVGPLAARAGDRLSWAGVVVALAFATTVVGALLTGALGMAATAESTEEMARAFVTGLGFGLLGLVMLGWLVGPLLLIPSLVWALLMRLLLGRR
jgi:hypothetical protein